MTEQLREHLQASLGKAYTLGRELGGGAMSRVFVAREEALGRDVVVKLLSPEMIHGLSAERFAREIKLAAALQEPHIVPVLAAGTTSDALPWYTMPYIAGESLRTRMLAGGVQPSDVVSILRDIATALEYAHARGIVHRDIKPENVLLSGRTAVVTDFGIAKALDASKTDAPGGTLTQIGTSLGTPAYMAPEQAAGDDVDARADIYSWGVIAYELLSGRHPFAGKRTSQQLIAAHIAELPEEILNRTPDLPPGLAALVMRCLEKESSERPADARELLDELQRPATHTPLSVAAQPSPVQPTPVIPPAAPRRRSLVAPMAAAVVLALALGAAVYARGPRGAATGKQAEPLAQGIAVLPFENLGDASDAYFADGMTDELRGKLAALPGLKVIARRSAADYRHTSKTMQQIAQELGVRYLLSGQVTWEKVPGKTSKVRVNPELIEVVPGSTPTIKWSQAFAKDLTEVFQVQADIATKVAAELNVALGVQQQRELAERPTSNLDAYDAYLKGEAATQQLNAFDPPSLRRGIALYTQAVTLDPNFAPAWAHLGRARALLYSASSPSPALAREALRAVERAQKLAPDRSESRLASAEYERRVSQDNARSLEVVKAGLVRTPDDADLLGYAARASSVLGQMDSALVYAVRAQALDPRSAFAAQQLGRVLQILRRYPEALEAYDNALSLNPGNLLLIERKAMVALEKGALDGARSIARSATVSNPAVGVGVDPDVLIAYFATYWDLYWVLDDAQQRRLLQLPITAFDGNLGVFGMVRAETFWLRGDSAKARAWADTTRRVFEADLRATPDDPQREALLGLSLAYLGRKADAMKHGERAAALLPMKQDAEIGAYVRVILARIYVAANLPDKAIDVLTAVAAAPWYVTPAWLRIDPTWAPLRGNPRFQKLTQGS